MNWAEIFKLNKELKAYSTSQIFNIGDHIEHKTFGKGYVQNRLGDKIEVLFEDKTRLLKHTS